MASKRTSMNKIREIIRLHECGLSQRKIVNALKISRPVVKDYLQRCQKAGLHFCDIEKMSDTTLLNRLGCGTAKPAGKRLTQLRSRFEHIARELRRVGVTLLLLWQEYATECKGPHYSYSRFCRHYRMWARGSQADMHIEHKAGDKIFVDFAGKKLWVTNLVTGERKEVEVYVAILGASQLTYAEAVPSQKKQDFIKATANAFQYFGGAPAAIVPDCLKSAVTKGNKYEPDLNQEYAAMARYFDTTILPARPEHPKDKALVENAVNLIYQRVYAPMRAEVFGSLEELNRRIIELLEEHNNKRMQKFNLSRHQLFEQIEKASLKALPAQPYRPPNFAGATVQMNYHVYLKEDKHYYSVPHTLKGQKTGFIYTDSAVEIIHNNTRVAVHKRDRSVNGYTTNKDHMPSHHRFYAEWNPDRISRWAFDIGDEVRTLCIRIMNHRSHPEQAFKACIGVISLAKKFGRQRVNRACHRALSFGSYSYKTVKNILEKKLDLIEEENTLFDKLPAHDNVRGADYYKQGGEQ